MTVYPNSKLISIVGPTASGKTGIAVALAKKFNGQIISADSRQVFQGMDIGTAKPSGQRAILKTRGRANRKYLVYKKIPHYLLDFLKPDQIYTAGEFKKDATLLIRNIHRKNKIPFLVGGTGLYISAIIDNLEIPSAGPNSKLRKKLEKEIAKFGTQFVFEKLVAQDPKAAFIVDKKNPRRIIRALEIIAATGRPFSAKKKIGPPLFDVLRIGIRIPRTMLKKRISQRVDEMIKKGLVAEVRHLLKKYGPNARAFNAIGYREIIDHLQGKISLPTAIDKIKNNTWHYARRQLSWFARDKKIRWVRNSQQMEKLVKKFLKKMN